MFGFDDAIGLGGLALGAVNTFLGASSARDANAANIAASREQMAFQERMRSTQYQTAVKDLKAAGLNPMLAYSQGGAGTPSGAMAVSRPEYDPSAGAASIQSALSAVQVANQAAQAKAVIRNTDADTANKLAQTGLIAADIQYRKAQAALASAQHTSETYRPQLLTKQAQLFDSQSRQIDTLLFDTMAKLRADTALASSSAKQIDSQRVLMKALQENSFTSGWAPYLYDVFRPGR